MRSAAETMQSKGLAPSQRRFDMGELWRVGLWGTAAAAALVLAAVASTSDAGNDRMLLALAQWYGKADPTKTARSFDDKEAQRLIETVRMLSADRDRLLARISALEQSVDDITGSIKRVESAVQSAPAAAPAQPPPVVAAPEAVPSSGMPQAEPAVTTSPEGASKTEFGLDVGGANTIEGLRALWVAVRGRHAALLEGLRPIVHLRESNRPGGVELRLVAGPVASAATAARICATMAAAGAVCQPSLFDGKRLAQR